MKGLRTFMFGAIVACVGCGGIDVGEDGEELSTSESAYSAGGTCTASQKICSICIDTSTVTGTAVQTSALGGLIAFILPSGAPENSIVRVVRPGYPLSAQVGCLDKIAETPYSSTLVVQVPTQPNVILPGGVKGNEYELTIARVRGSSTPTLPSPDWVESFTF